MNYNLKRHKLLKLLHKQYVINDSLDVPRDDKLAIEYSEIYKYLNCDSYKLRLIIAPLMDENEIDVYDVAYDGLFLYEKGLSAFTNKKYIKLNNNLIWNSIKNWVQTLIPVLSLIIALIAIRDNNESTNKELLELKDRIKQIELRESTPQASKETHPRQLTESDSLKIE